MKNKIIGEFYRTTSLVIKTEDGQLVGVISPPKETENTSKTIEQDITDRVIQAIVEHECAKSGTIISDFTTGVGYRSIEFSCDTLQDGEDEPDSRVYTIEPTTLY